MIAILGETRGQQAGGKILRLGDGLLAAESVADDHLREAAPRVDRQVAQLERTGRQLLAAHQDAVDIDVNLGGGEQDAGKPQRRVAERVGLEAEIPRYADAAKGTQ